MFAGIRCPKCNWRPSGSSCSPRHRRLPLSEHYARRLSRRRQADTRMRSLTVKRRPSDQSHDLALLLWPSFSEKRGLLFLDIAGCRPGRRTLAAHDGWDRTGTEAFWSHIHPLDLFEHDRRVWRSRAKTFDRGHRHFRAAERLGQALAASWFLKLCCDFPEDHFRVYYTRDDQPTVRFHRVYEGEPAWSDDPAPRQVRQAQLIVWDTRGLPTRRLRPIGRR